MGFLRLCKTMTKNLEANSISFALIKQDITYIKDNVRDIKVKLEGQYVTREQFDPIKRIVYGMVGLVLTAVAVGVLNLVINK